MSPFFSQISPKMTLPGIASSLCPSPSGRHLAAAVGRDLFLWQVSSGILLRHLRACHLQAVTRVRFTDDGSRLLTASEDGGVRAWRMVDLTSLPLEGRPGRRSDPVPFLRWSDHELRVTDLIAWGSGCSARAATCSLDGTARIRCLVTGSTLLEVHAGTPLHSVAVDACESVLCAGTDDGRVLLFPLLDPPRNVQVARSEMKPRTYSSHGGPVTCLSVSLDGHLLASGSDDGRVKVWRLDQAGEDQADPLRTIEHAGRVSAVEFVVPPLGLLRPDDHLPSVYLAPALHKVEASGGEGLAEVTSVFVTPEAHNVAGGGAESLEEESEDEPIDDNDEGGGAEGATQKGRLVEERAKSAELRKVNFNLYQLLKSQILESRQADD